METPTASMSKGLNLKLLVGVAVHAALALSVLWLARRRPWPTWQEAVFYGVMTAQSLVVAVWLGLGRPDIKRFELAFALLCLIFFAFSFNSMSDYRSRSFNTEPMLMDQLWRSLTPASVMLFILFLQRRRGVWLVNDDEPQHESPFQISMRDLFIATFVAAVLLGAGRLLSHFPEFARMLVLPVCPVVLGLHIMWVVLSPRFDWLSMILGAITFGVVAVAPVAWLRFPPVGWGVLIVVFATVFGLQLGYWRANGLRLISN